MGSNYLGREAAAGTCLDTLQLEAVGFGTELLIYVSPSSSFPPPPGDWQARNLRLFLFPSAPTLEESPTSQSGSLCLPPAVAVASLALGGRGAARGASRSLGAPARARTVAAVGPGGGGGGRGKAAGDRCTPLTALSISPVAPCHWLSAMDRQRRSL